MKYLIPLLAAALFLAGYWLGRSSAKIETVETVRVDTVYYRKPEPFRVSAPTLVAVRVPRVLFAPGDTVVRMITADADSVEVAVQTVRKEYCDSTYRAQVSGPQIGPLGPTLDWIETYNTTRTQTVTRRSRFAVTAGAGVGYTPQGFQPHIGVSVGVVLWQW